MAKHKPRLAVWKFASCDGCQLSLLDCEDDLLAVAGAIDIAYFKEATEGEIAGVYDVSLVEGSITTPHDAQRIRDVRQRSKTLITIGACATAGGIQALRNFADVAQALGAHGERVHKPHEIVPANQRGLEINQHRVLGELLRRNNDPAAHHLQVARHVLQAKFDRHFVGGFVDHLDRV